MIPIFFAVLAGIVIGVFLAVSWAATWAVGDAVVDWFLAPGFDAHTDQAIANTVEPEVRS